MRHKLFDILNYKFINENPVVFEIDINPDTIVLDWKISHYCNLDCSYCFFDTKTRHQNDKDIDSINKTLDLINDSKFQFIINICGGEPFLINQIYNILEKLKKNCSYIIGTNLIYCDINKLTSVIDPFDIIHIQASYHFNFLNNKQKTSFIEKYIYLQNLGFNIALGIVLHPSYSKTKIVKTIKLLKDQGIKNIALKTFIGKYSGKEYPKNLHYKDKIFIKEFSIFKHEVDIASLNFNCFNKECMAGSRYFHINVDGNISNCDMIRMRIKNVKEIDCIDDFISKNSQKYICKRESCYCFGPFLKSDLANNYSI